MSIHISFASQLHNKLAFATGFDDDRLAEPLSRFQGASVAERMPGLSTTMGRAGRLRSGRDPMRIALVTERFDGLAGGLERWTVQFAAHLLQQGHEVHVVTFAEANHALPVVLHVLDYKRSVLARGQAVEAYLERLRPDIAHDTGNGWSGDVFHPQTGSHLSSLDHYIAAHGPVRRMMAGLSPSMTLRRRRMAKLEVLQASMARRVIAVSRRIARDLTDRHGVPESFISVIPNGVDTARFAPPRLARFRKATRQALGVGNSVVFLGAAYNLRLKGMDTAIRALAAVRATGADVRLVVAGGTPNGFWDQLIADLGLGGRVHMLGPVEDMAPIFAAADVYVHPTRWDACSLSTIEAGAAALPVITTAMNGASELIEHGGTGFVLADPEDVGALSACMQRLLASDMRRRIGQAAHEASKAHDIRINLSLVETILMNVLAVQESHISMRLDC